MFDWFKRNAPTSPASEARAGQPLIFKDGAAALEYACKFLDCTLRERSFLPALVVDAPVRITHDGNQVATLRVASEEGGFVVAATTLGPKGPKLQPGSFVAWQAGRKTESGWVGTIIGTLKTELRDNRWLGDQRFST